VELRVNLPSALSPEQRDKLLKVAHGCTVHQSITLPPKVDIRIASHEKDPS
jgi:hypothetical protein